MRKRLADFPVKNVPDRIQADMREMKERLASSAALMEEAGKALEACSKDVTTPNGRSLASAVAVIRTELHPATVDRLDAFLGQCRDAARQKARGKKPSQIARGPAQPGRQRLAAGQPLGRGRAPTSPSTCGRRGRWCSNYLQETDAPPNASKLLTDYQKTITPSVDIDEIAQLIDHLPPADPITVPAGDTVELQVGQGPAEASPITCACRRSIRPAGRIPC